MNSNKELHIEKPYFHKISLPTQKGFELIDIYEILYLEADSAYTVFHLENNRKIIATKNIGYFEEELLNDPFIRVHQSFMVNITKIKSYVRADNGYVVLLTGKNIKVARSKKDMLLDFFKTRRNPNTK